MSLRFRVRYPSTGDVLEPKDWNLNMAEYADEWNGLLDRDNLPNASVTEPMITAGTFNTFSPDGFAAATPFVPDLTGVGWQADDASGNRVGRVSPALTSDALLICEYSGWHSWNNGLSGTWSTNTHAGVSPSELGVQDAIRYRITVDGVEVAESGWIYDIHAMAPVYLCGAYPAIPGTRTIQVEVQVAGVWWFAGSESHAYEETTLALRQPTLQDRELIVDVRRR